MAFCVRQLYYFCFVFCFVLVLHTTKLWHGGYFFWLFVTKMTIHRDDDVLQAAFCRQTLWAWSQVVDQKLLNGFVDIAVPYLAMGLANGDA